MSPHSDDDLALVARAKGGDEKAFEELATRFQPIIYEELKKYMNHADADEQALTVLWRILRYIASFDPAKAPDSSHPFKTWVYRVAGNIRHDYWRLKNAREGRETSLENESGVMSYPAGGESPEGSLLEQERQAETNARVMKLRQKLKASDPLAERILWLRFGEGFSAKEVATILGCSENYVHSRASRVRQQLRKNSERKLGGK